MNAILGMVELALRKESDAIIRDCLNTALESADHLLGLLNDLLDSAKIESGKLELESVPLSMRRVLDQTTRVLSLRASEKGLAFYCRVPEDLPDAVIGDKMRLRQVLLNLAGNAIKFTDRGEVAVTVRVESLASEEVHLEFAVRDTGIGIPQNDLDRIFKPFAQADASTARRFGGTGLGLSISARLVALMGGASGQKANRDKAARFTSRFACPGPRNCRRKRRLRRTVRVCGPCRCGSCWSRTTLPTRNSRPASSGKAATRSMLPGTVNKPCICPPTTATT